MRRILPHLAAIYDRVLDFHRVQALLLLAILEWAQDSTRHIIQHLVAISDRAQGIHRDQVDLPTMVGQVQPICPAHPGLTTTLLALAADTRLNQQHRTEIHAVQTIEGPAQSENPFHLFSQATR